MRLVTCEMDTLGGNADMLGRSVARPLMTHSGPELLRHDWQAIERDAEKADICHGEKSRHLAMEVFDHSTFAKRTLFSNVECRDGIVHCLQASS